MYPGASDVAVCQPQATHRPWDAHTSALQTQERAQGSAGSGRDAMGSAWRWEPPCVSVALLCPFSSAYEVLLKGKLVS